MLGKYGKAIIAFIALAVAILNANGFSIPEETTEQVTNTVILLLGTFGVFRITNTEDAP